MSNFTNICACDHTQTIHKQITRKCIQHTYNKILTYVGNFQKNDVVIKCGSHSNGKKCIDIDLSGKKGILFKKLRGRLKKIYKGNAGSYLSQSKRIYEYGTFNNWFGLTISIPRIITY